MRTASVAPVSFDNDGAASVAVHPRAVQPKLTVGPVDDPLEREADRIADSVARSAESSAPQRRNAPSLGSGNVEGKPAPASLSITPAPAATVQRQDGANRIPSGIPEIDENTAGMGMRLTFGGTVLSPEFDSLDLLAGYQKYGGVGARFDEEGIQDMIFTRDLLPMGNVYSTEDLKMKALGFLFGGGGSGGPRDDGASPAPSTGLTPGGGTSQTLPTSGMPLLPAPLLPLYGPLLKKQTPNPYGIETPSLDVPPLRLDPELLFPDPDLLQRKEAGPASTEGAAPSPRATQHVGAVQAGAGQPLPGPDRRFFESQFGTSFQDVRIHTGPTADTAAQSLAARAFTIGTDVAFKSGEYRPGTQDGRKLLAHELTHVVQQAGGRGVGTIQRQEDPEAASDGPNAERTQAQAGASGGTAPTSLGANEVIPISVGTDILLGRVLPDFVIEIARGQDPETAAMAESLDQVQATVTTSSADRFEAVIPGPLSVGTQTLTDIRVTLRRSRRGSFTFEVTAQDPGQSRRTTLFRQSGLTASQSGGVTALSSQIGEESVRQVKISAEGGNVRVGIYTESFPDLRDVPLIPESLDVLEITPLSAGATPEQREQEIQNIREEQTAERRQRDQEVSVGLGVGGFDDPRFLLSTAWRMRFGTTAIFDSTSLDPALASTLGSVFYIPLEVRMLYLPEATVLGTVTTGIDVAAPTEVPIHLRLAIGVGGGAADTEEGMQPIMGMPLGVGVGTEVENVRIMMRYDAFQDFLDGDVDIHTFSVTAGFSY